jgi:hypothetical protein
LFHSVEIWALTGGFVSSFGNGSSLFRRELEDWCLGEGVDVIMPLACRGRSGVGVEVLSCLPDRSPVAMALVTGRFSRGLLTRLGLGDLSPVSRVLAVTGTSARPWVVVSGEVFSNQVSFPGAS